MIYPGKRTSGGRERDTLISQYSDDKYLCNILAKENNKKANLYWNSKSILVSLLMKIHSDAQGQEKILGGRENFM